MKNLVEISTLLRRIADILEGDSHTQQTKEAAPEVATSKLPVRSRHRPHNRRFVDRENKNSDAIRWVLGDMGLRPIITLRWLVEEGFLARQLYNEDSTVDAEKAINIPTKKGSPYFRISGMGLTVTQEGKDLLTDLQSTGCIPANCETVTA